MGTILFYIFESTLCLTILYFLFRLFFRKDTLFRTNRFLLLAGTMACTLLPLLQIDVPQYTTLQLPITTVRHLLTEKEIDVQREGGTGEKHLSEEASLLMAEKGEGIEGDRTNVIHTIPVIWLLGGCYFIGALIVLAFLFIPAMNLSGMMSSRMDERLSELGVRKTYGATNMRLIGQVLWENLLLTCIGGLLGLLIC